VTLHFIHVIPESRVIYSVSREVFILAYHVGGLLSILQENYEELIKLHKERPLPSLPFPTQYIIQERHYLALLKRRSLQRFVKSMKQA
jgi:hypothetical protein